MSPGSPGGTLTSGGAWKGCSGPSGLRERAPPAAQVRRKRGSPCSVGSGCEGPQHEAERTRTRGHAWSGHKPELRLQHPTELLSHSC